MVNRNTRLAAYSIPSSAIALHFARKATRPVTRWQVFRALLAVQRMRQAVKDSVRGMGGQ